MGTSSLPAEDPAPTVGDFRRALDLVLQSEGHYVDDPDDHGGATNLGVTQHTYDGWRARHGWAQQSVALIKYDEAAAIYWRDYWNAGRCDRMPWPLSLIHFDCVVNNPMAEATRLLQRALGLTPDGILGPLTLQRCAPAGPRDCYAYLLQRAFHYRALAHAEPSQQKFLAGGWLTRLEVLYAEVA